MKFRKKPVIIDAVQWVGNNLREIIDLIGLHQSAEKWTWEEYEKIVDTQGLKIFTPEGPVIASIGSWIIKGVSGEFYPCRPDIFEQTFESIDECPNLSSCENLYELAEGNCAWWIMGACEWSHDEKDREECVCINKKCEFHSAIAEQNCDGECHGEPAIASCRKAILEERHGGE